MQPSQVAVTNASLSTCVYCVVCGVSLVFVIRLRQVSDSRKDYFGSYFGFQILWYRQHVRKQVRSLARGYRVGLGGGPRQCGPVLEFAFSAVQRVVMRMQPCSAELRSSIASLRPDGLQPGGFCERLGVAVLLRSNVRD